MDVAAMSSSRMSVPAMITASRKVMSENQGKPYDYVQPGRDNPCVDIRVSRTLLSRALNATKMLLKEVLNIGGRIEVVREDHKWTTRVVVDGMNLSLSVNEPQKRVPRNEAPENMFDSRWHRLWESPTVLIPSGDLRVILSTPLRSYQSLSEKKWRDGPKKGTIEEQIDSIVESLPKIVADVRQILAEEEEEARLRAIRQEEQRIRQEKFAEEMRLLEEMRADRRARLTAIEERRMFRVQTLERHLKNWEEYGRVESFLDSIEREISARGVLSGPETDLGKWLSWARKWNNARHPINHLSDLRLEK